MVQDVRMVWYGYSQRWIMISLSDSRVLVIFLLDPHAGYVDVLTFWKSNQVYI